MAIPFIEALKERDPELYKIASGLEKLATKPGALDAKTKILITMALDAYAGTGEGVKNLAKTARKVGATDEEISEALQIAYFVAGNIILATSGKAFED